MFYVFAINMTITLVFIQLHHERHTKQYAYSSLHGRIRPRLAVIG